MKLTPAVLEACYDFLRATPPFFRWGLPRGSEVLFRVLKTRESLGTYKWSTAYGHVISVSAGRVSHTNTLVSLMAHEMVHMRQEMLGLPTTHGAAFRRMAKIVCRHHGFDPAEF